MLARSIGFIKQTKAQILEVLKSYLEVLARIQTEFHTMIRARTNKGQLPIAITCCYEELPLPGIREVSTEAFISSVRILFCMLLYSKLNGYVLLFYFLLIHQ